MDIDFKSALDIASKIIGAVNNTVSTVKALRTQAKGGGFPADAVDKIVALSIEVSEAQMDMTTLKTEILELQRAQKAVDRIEQRKRNYVLSETPMGERVYCLKPDADTGEPPHEVCPDCFQRDQIRILQPRGTVLECTTCKTAYRVAESATPTTTPPSRLAQGLKHF